MIELMNFCVEKAGEKHIPQIIVLLREFAEFENLSEYCGITEEKLKDAMFGENAFVEGLITFDTETPLGYALFYPNFSSFRGQKGLYLEDIYIKQEYRGLRIGEKMLRHLARIAKERGCERIDFQVLDWNTPAIKFYEKLGAIRDEQERHFKFTDEAFESLAS